MKHIFKKSFVAIFFSITILATHHTPSDLVEITTINPHIKTQIYYATPHNFVGKILYDSAKCYLRKAVAVKLSNVQKELETQGIGLKVWDGYRPLSAQRKMWALLPNPSFVADPSKGSKHNRGAAVDVTLIDLSTGKELEMPTGFDDFSEKAASYRTNGISQAAIKNRTLLQTVMCKHGFLIFASEWWHFNDSEWEKYPILDIDFDQIEKHTN